MQSLVILSQIIIFSSTVSDLPKHFIVQSLDIYSDCFKMLASYIIFFFNIYVLSPIHLLSGLFIAQNY